MYLNQRLNIIIGLNKKLIRGFIRLVKILAENVTMALIRENSDSRKTGSLNICSHWCLYQMQEYFPIVLPISNDKCIFQLFIQS